MNASARIMQHGSGLVVDFPDRSRFKASYPAVWMPVVSGHVIVLVMEF
jgi:hypothetical protein